MHNRSQHKDIFASQSLGRTRETVIQQKVYKKQVAQSRSKLDNMAIYGFNKLTAEASATKHNDSLMILNETGDE